MISKYGSLIAGVSAFFLSLGFVLFAAPGQGFAAEPVTHIINMTVMEVEGTTTSDWQIPPLVDPETLSSGYQYEKPGIAKKGDKVKWKVASYLFTPGHITVRLGDRVAINAFVTNGNAHNVVITGPDANVVMPPSAWSRGSEYKVTFVAEKTGIYTISCLTHAPTMTSTVYVIP